MFLPIGSCTPRGRRHLGWTSHTLVATDTSGPVSAPEAEDPQLGRQAPSGTRSPCFAKTTACEELPSPRFPPRNRGTRRLSLGTDQLRKDLSPGRSQAPAAPRLPRPPTRGATAPPPPSNLRLKRLCVLHRSRVGQVACGPVTGAFFAPTSSTFSPEPFNFCQVLAAGRAVTLSADAIRGATADAAGHTGTTASQSRRTWGRQCHPPTPAPGGWAGPAPHSQGTRGQC